MNTWDQLYIPYISSSRYIFPSSQQVNNDTYPIFRVEGEKTYSQVIYQQGNIILHVIASGSYGIIYRIHQPSHGDYVLKLIPRLYSPELQLAPLPISYDSSDREHVSYYPPEEAEIRIWSKLSQLVRQRKTPHIRPCYFQFFVPHIPRLVPNDGICLKLLLKRFYENRLLNECYIGVGQWNHGVTMTQFLQHHDDMTLYEWKIILFQLLYTLHVIEHTFSGFRHNDLSPNNIMIEELPTDHSTIVYVLFQTYFRITNCTYSIQFIDFDWSNIPYVIENSRVYSSRSIQQRSRFPISDLLFFFETSYAQFSHVMDTYPELIQFIHYVKRTPSQQTYYGLLHHDFFLCFQTNEEIIHPSEQVYCI